MPQAFHQNHWAIIHVMRACGSSKTVVVKFMATRTLLFQVKNRQ